MRCMRWTDNKNSLVKIADRSKSFNAWNIQKTLQQKVSRRHVCTAVQKKNTKKVFMTKNFWEKESTSRLMEKAENSLHRPVVAKFIGFCVLPVGYWCSAYTTPLDTTNLYSSTTLRKAAGL